jgi:3',5'-cyclic AMP phosphodiesterase CpdA
LPAPWVAVPGNHDIPLFDVARRAFDPFGRYRRLVDPCLEPSFQDDEVAVLGLNTVRPRVWKGGLVRASTRQRLERLAEEAAGRARILFAHHPFTRAPESRQDLVRGWREAVAAMEAAGVDVVLTGHHHQWGHSESRAFAVGGPHRLVVVRASTSVSQRRRGEPNSYALVEVDEERICVRSRVWDGQRFVAGAVHRYPRVSRRGPAAAVPPSGGPIARSRGT